MKKGKVGKLSDGTHRQHLMHVVISLCCVRQTPTDKKTMMQYKRRSGWCPSISIWRKYFYNFTSCHWIVDYPQRLLGCRRMMMAYNNKREELLSSFTLESCRPPFLLIPLLSIWCLAISPNLIFKSSLQVTHERHSLEPFCRLIIHSFISISFPQHFLPFYLLCWADYPSSPSPDDNRKSSGHITFFSSESNMTHYLLPLDSGGGDDKTVYTLHSLMTSYINSGVMVCIVCGTAASHMRQQETQHQQQ